MLVAHVRHALARHAMIPAGSRVVVGCSGGPDSMALLSALARLAPELGFSVVAASVDHGTRPEAAAEIERVAGVAARLGVVHVRSTLDVPAARRAARRTERSVHGVARTLRYAMLFEIAQRHDATRVAVAHTMDDQAETVLLRLLRGAELSGMGAMRPAREDGLVRPMLGVRRSEVMAYLEHEELPFAQDSSNADPRYLRARLRFDLLPRLTAEAPRLVEHLSELADEIAAVAAWRAAVAGPIADAAWSRSPAGGQVRSGILSDAPEALRPAVASLILAELTGRPARRRWVAAVVSLAMPGAAGEVPLPGGWLRRGVGDEAILWVPGQPAARVRRGGGSPPDREGV